MATNGKPIKMKSLIEVHLQRKLHLLKKKKYPAIPSCSSIVDNVVDGVLVVPW